MSCVFCPDNWDNLDIVSRQRDDRYAIVNPLEPVTEGHVLVIAETHTKDASKNYRIAGELMEIAAAYVLGAGIQANIITSIGPLATQTVFHTHVHIVPRVLNDDLPLPWTPQHEAKKKASDRIAAKVEAEIARDVQGDILR